MDLASTFRISEADTSYDGLPIYLTACIYSCNTPYPYSLPEQSMRQMRDCASSRKDQARVRSASANLFLSGNLHIME
ncbi:hypothetical protein V6Z11_A12G212200 [Gossypium hirsutum]